MKKIGSVLLMLMLSYTTLASEKATYIEPDYQPPKVVYEFYLEDPAMMASALYWLRALINPLTESPYDMAPEFMDIKVVIHGTEIATVVRENYKKYHESVERMRYYAALGVEFKVCGIAAEDFGYQLEDFYEFIQVVPSAFTELVHWQQQGYALIMPRVLFRTTQTDKDL